MSQLDKEFFRSLVESDPRAIMVTGSNSEVLYVNKKFSAITGYSSGEILGRTPAMLESGIHLRSFYKKMWSALENESCWEGLIWNRRKNGETYPQWLSINTVGERNDRIFVGVFIDVGEIKSFDSRLTAFAYYDELTQLSNRALFWEMLAVHVKRDIASRKHFTVIFIDVNDFKKINDLHGHATGDKVLNQVAQRLKSCLREHDILARFAGDEFAAIVGIGENLASLEVICRRLDEAMVLPIFVKDRNHHVSVSVGTAVFPIDGVTSEGLIEAADNAMYSAKNAGRARDFDYEL